MFVFNKSMFVNVMVILLYMMIIDVISLIGDMLKIDYKIYIVCGVKFVVFVRSFFVSIYYLVMNVLCYDW